MEVDAIVVAETVDSVVEEDGAAGEVPGDKDDRSQVIHLGLSVLLTAVTLLLLESVLVGGD